MSEHRSDDHLPAGKVGAVVVNHNAGPSLGRCVESLVASGVAEVVVVDNDSSDGSLRHLVERFPAVPIYRTGKNLGYGSAANIGRKMLDVDYVIVSNPDLLVDLRATSTLVAYLEGHPEAAVVGPRIVSADGTPYPSARAFPNLVDALGHALLSVIWPDNRFSRRYRMEGQPRAAGTVDWVSGAFVVVRSSAFDAVGGFDEGYFMYVEDLDLCWRLRALGWRTAYEPAAAVCHRGGLSSGRHPVRMLVAHHRSTWRFACRSLAGPGRLLLPAVAVVLGVRLGMAITFELWPALLRSRFRRG